MPAFPIYMDHHATTPVDPRVLDAMLPWFRERFGNAASLQHGFGRQAAEAVDEARAQVASLVGAEPRAIVFTSGATESNNLAIKGAAGFYRLHGHHLITVATEHHAVLDPCRRLAKEGFDVTILPVDACGRIDPAQVAAAIRADTILVSVMLANNEMGTVQPIQAVGKICRERGVLLHSDAAQAVGNIPVDVNDLGVDLLSISAHKMYGPKGMGALFVRRPKVRLEPLFDGGGHEMGLRSGTLPVPLIVGFGVACRIAQEEMTESATRIARLRDRLQVGLVSRIAEIRVNGHGSERLPNNLSISFAGVDAQALMLAMPEVALSSGAACTTASVERSHVLQAIGLPAEWARGTLRFGLGRSTTEDEVDFVVEKTVRSVGELRARAPSAGLAETAIPR